MAPAGGVAGSVDQRCVADGIANRMKNRPHRDGMIAAAAGAPKSDGAPDQFVNGWVSMIENFVIGTPIVFP